MTIKSNVKAGALAWNHNETLAVRSDVKAGLACRYCAANHNETLAVRSDMKAGGAKLNHNESFRR